MKVEIRISIQSSAYLGSSPNLGSRVWHFLYFKDGKKWRFNINIPPYPRVMYRIQSTLVDAIKNMKDAEKTWRAHHIYDDEADKVYLSD